MNDVGRADPLTRARELAPTINAAADETEPSGVSQSHCSTNCTPHGLSACSIPAWSAATRSSPLPIYLDLEAAHTVFGD